MCNTSCSVKQILWVVLALANNIHGVNTKKAKTSKAYFSFSKA